MSESDSDAVERELTRLVRSAEQIHRALQRSGGTGPLEKSAYRLLAHVVQAGPVRLSDLAGLACVDLSTVSRQVTQLETQGLVRRTADPADRRASLLVATDEGGQLLRETRLARGRLLRDVLSDWPLADRDRFGQLLTQFNDDVARRLADPVSTRSQRQESR